MTTHAQNKTTVRNNINVISSCSNLLFIMIKQHVRFPLYLPCAAIMSENSTKIHLLAKQWRWNSLAQFQHKNLQKLCLLWSVSAGQTTPLVSHSWIETKASVSGSSKMRKGMLTTSAAEHPRTGSPSKTQKMHAEKQAYDFSDYSRWGQTLQRLLPDRGCDRGRGWGRGLRL